MLRTRTQPLVRPSWDGDSMQSHVAFSQAVPNPQHRLVTAARWCKVFRVQVDHLRFVATQTPCLPSQSCLFGVVECCWFGLNPHCSGHSLSFSLHGLMLLELCVYSPNARRAGGVNTGRSTLLLQVQWWKFTFFSLCLIPLIYRHLQTVILKLLSWSSRRISISCPISTCSPGVQPPW